MSFQRNYFQLRIFEDIIWEDICFLAFPKQISAHRLVCPYINQGSFREAER